MGTWCIIHDIALLHMFDKFVLSYGQWFLSTADQLTDKRFPIVLLSKVNTLCKSNNWYLFAVSLWNKTQGCCLLPGDKTGKLQKSYRPYHGLSKTKFLYRK